MISPGNIHKFILFFLLLSLISTTAFSNDGLSANPDHFRSSLAVTSDGVPVASIAERISLKWFSLGGLIEVRNEKRFNQEILPNHNWRGVVRAEFLLKDIKWNTLETGFITGLYHESAHPTMGIVVETDNAYEKIYDKTYRWMVLNAANFGNRVSRSFMPGNLTAELFYHFYFMSKNTPELSGGVLTQGHGLSGGMQFDCDVGKAGAAYLSLYGRFIFDSRMKATGEVYSEDHSVLTLKETTYPVIHRSGTFSLKAGLNRKITPGLRIGLFTGFLYGHPLGFIDSRDIRRNFSLGFEIFRV